MRAFEVQPRLELKVCFERSPEGPEHWEKLLARRLPLGPAWSSVLAAHLRDALGAEETRGHPASPLDTVDHLEAWLAELGLALVRSVLVQKRIWKLPAPPALAVEVVDLRLSDGRPLRSVAIGAPTAALALGVARRLGLPGGRDAAGPHVGGYPEALARLAGA